MSNELKNYKLLALIIIFSQLSCAKELVDTFQEAKTIGISLETDIEIKIQHYDELIPYFIKNYSPILMECFEKTENPDNSPFEMVIALGENGEVIKLYKNHETNISKCLFKALENDNFPKPTVSPYYLYISMNFTNPKPQI